MKQVFFIIFFIRRKRICSNYQVTYSLFVVFFNLSDANKKRIRYFCAIRDAVFSAESSTARCCPKASQLDLAVAQLTWSEDSVKMGPDSTNSMSENTQKQTHIYFTKK